jgi:hypothetical protein
MIMADIWSANTGILIHCNGDNNSTVFSNSALLSSTITANGNARISTARAKYGTSSAFFDGSGDFLSFPFYYKTGASNWTLELWVYFTGAPHADGSAILCIGADTGNRPISVGRYQKFLWADISSGPGQLLEVLSTDNAIPINGGVWQHIAVERYNNVITLYVDGLAVGATAYSGNIATYNNIAYIGRIPWATQLDIPAYVQDVRFTLDVARYCGNFTPPQALLDDPTHPTSRLSGIGFHGNPLGASHRITNVVARLGTPGRFRVCLFLRRENTLFRETWSNDDGVYEFNSIPYIFKGYYIIAFDHSGTPVNAAIGDYITPELMTS